MTNKLAVIIQGPSSHVSELKNAWQGYDIIWSTWDGEQSKYDINDNVIYNTLPVERGVQNIALQKTSTLNGILKAKELGYDRVLKWRSDLLPKNTKKLVNSFKRECLNFLAWHNYGKYFVDYFVEGPITDVYKIWDVPTIIGPYAERITTDHIFSLNMSNINFILNDLNEDNEIYWIKYNLYLSSLKTEDCYTLKILKDD